jgi:uncharacterized HAD superfamily protein
MKIMVDIDGCIGDFVSSMALWTAQHKRVYGLHDPKTYAFHEDESWSKAYPTDESFVEALQEAITDRVYLHETPLALSASTLHELHDEGHNIIIATDRAFGNPFVDTIAYQDTRAWLEYNGYIYDSLVITPHKEDIDADIFIEDSPKNMKNIMDAGGKVIRIPHAYNISAPSHLTMPIWSKDTIQSLMQ